MCLDELATMASGGDCIFDCGKDHHPSLFGRHHWPGSMHPAGKAHKFNPQVLFLEDKLGNNLMRKKDSCGFRHSTHVSDSSAGIFTTYWSILIEKIWRCRVQRAKDLNCWDSSLWHVMCEPVPLCLDCFENIWPCSIRFHPAFFPSFLGLGPTSTATAPGAFAKYLGDGRCFCVSWFHSVPNLFFYSGSMETKWKKYWVYTV